MKRKHLMLLLLNIFITTLLGACSPENSTKTMPVVNDENCKSENIAKIEDKTMREQFTSMCIRRSNFKPSPKKEW